MRSASGPPPGEFARACACDGGGGACVRAVGAAACTIYARLAMPHTHTHTRAARYYRWLWRTRFSLMLLSMCKQISIKMRFYACVRCRCGGRTNRIEHWRRQRRRQQLIEAAGPTHKCPGEAKLCAHKILQNYTQYRDTTSHRRRRRRCSSLSWLFFFVFCVSSVSLARAALAQRAHTHVSNTHTGPRSERVSHTLTTTNKEYTHTVYIYAYNLCTTSRELVGTAPSVCLSDRVRFVFMVYVIGILYTHTHARISAELPRTRGRKTRLRCAHTAAARLIICIYTHTHTQCTDIICARCFMLNRFADRGRAGRAYARTNQLLLAHWHTPTCVCACCPTGPGL